jgi:hypothetical protein
MTRTALPILVLLLLPLHTWAWGPTGHRVVGAIAEAHLDRKARREVRKILGTESLAIAATWMDEVRSDPAYDRTHDWHWVTIPDGDTYATSDKNRNGDVVEAIGRLEALLRSDTVSPEKRKTCLRMLVHLVGDIHQPLHVGRGDDKGGNDIQVQWFSRRSTLHRVWDSGMIDESGLSYSELARSLDHPDPAEIKALQQGDAATWALEDLSYRARIYDVGQGADLGYAYQYRNWPLVQEQLLKAGIRLAGVLNELFR